MRARLNVWAGSRPDGGTRVVLADDLVRPVEQQLPVFTGNTKEPGDHCNRQRRRDVLDEVELLAARGRVADAVEHLERELLDLVVA